MPRYTERAQGVYRCRFVGTREVKITDRESGEEVVRWAWGFQELSDPTTVGFIDQLTGTSLRSPNSNAYKIASGLLGRKLQPNDDTDTCVGRVYDVWYGPNQAGNLAIVGVQAVQDAPGAAVAPPAAPNPAPAPFGPPGAAPGPERDPNDDLPF